MALELSTFKGIVNCWWPSANKVLHSGIVTWALMNAIMVSASAAEAMTQHIV